MLEFLQVVQLLTFKMRPLKASQGFSGSQLFLRSLVHRPVTKKCLQAPQASKDLLNLFADRPLSQQKWNIKAPAAASFSQTQLPPHPEHQKMTQQHTSAPPDLDALLAGLDAGVYHAPASSDPIDWGQSGNTNAASGNIFERSHQQSNPPPFRVPAHAQPTWVPESSILGLAPRGWQGPTRDAFSDAAHGPEPQWIQAPKPGQFIIGHYGPSAPSDWKPSVNHNPFENGYDIRKAPPSKDIWK